MHIPDGYLSPSTCAVLYGAAAPFWYIALKRVKAALSTRAVPLLSVFAAFSFVIMMFNLPLPGGTSGHAVGMGMAAIVLGPAVSMLAISMALLIQALFFGDGGITAFGANCFNMAIVGSLVAFAVYRIVSFRAELASFRRVVAAGLAGYAAINVAAFFAAVEFGIQPLFFHTPSGAPLYAPYPLTVSIPAMMIGHLTLAGLAELILSAGVVSYLQRADVEMLRLTAPDAADSAVHPPQSARTPPRGWAVRGLWATLAVLLVLTPLGIVAVGNAWGEWKAKDFADGATRQLIAAASGNRPLPERIPSGLQHLSASWKAPLADYSPSFIHNSSLGYLLSAVVGVALIALLAGVLRWRLAKARRRGDFVARTLGQVLGALQDALFAEDFALSRGFLQGIDPRVKLLGIGTLIVASVATHRLSILLLLFGVSLLLAVASHVPLRLLLTRVWIAVLLFTGIIALPAVFLTPGATLYRVPVLEWALTRQGLSGAAFLTLRAETTATFALLLILTTPWNRLLQSLLFFRVPAIAVAIGAMTYRYIFVFLQTARSMLESRQTRLVGRLQPSEQRRFATASVGVLLDKTVALSADVHTAMQARGFRGEVRLLDDLQMRPTGWLFLAILPGMAALLLWLGK